MLPPRSQRLRQLLARWVPPVCDIISSTATHIIAPAANASSQGSHVANGRLDSHSREPLMSSAPIVLALIASGLFGSVLWLLSRNERDRREATESLRREGRPRRPG